MKILTVVESKHLENTLKIANAMSEAVPMTITSVDNAVKYDFKDYDIVGFGSGIYFGKHDERILKFVDGLSDENAYSFVFSTSGGADFEKNNKALIQLLEKKNKNVLGTFSCKGLDKFFILRLFGGTNKGRPNEQDLADAQRFILDITEKYKKAEGK